MEKREEKVKETSDRGAKQVKYIKEKLSDSCEIKVNTHSGQECLKLADSCEIKVNTHSEL